MTESVKKIIAMYVAMKNFADGKLPNDWYLEMGNTLYKLEICDCLNVLITARPMYAVEGEMAVPLTKKSSHFGTIFITLNDDDCKAVYKEECAKMAELLLNEIAAITWKMDKVMEQGDIARKIENGLGSQPINVFWR